MKTKIALVGEDWDAIDLIENLPELELVGVFAPTLAHQKELFHLGKDEDWNPSSGFKIILAVDIPAVRNRLFAHYGSSHILSLKSPHASVSPRAQFGLGCIIQRGVTILPHVKIGKACKLNVNATIHHDASIGDFCTISPGATILGNVVIEEGVYIGAGAIIKQRCKIGRGAVIGAGAVVVKDVPAQKTYVGVPAKEKRLC